MITKLPKFLVFHFARFSKNNFTAEKNPTIVHIPRQDLELKDQFALEGVASTEATKYDWRTLVMTSCRFGQGRAEASPCSTARIECT